MMIAISFSRGGMELPNRTKAPTRWTRSQSSGLRSSALKGPRRPAPRGPDWIASATRFWSAVIVSGVSVVNLGALITFLPDRLWPPGGDPRGGRVAKDAFLAYSGLSPGGSADEHDGRVSGQGSRRARTHGHRRH